MKNKILPMILGSSLAFSMFIAPVGAQGFDTEIDDVEVVNTVTDTFIDEEGDEVVQETSYNKNGDIVEVSVEKGDLSSEDAELQAAGYYASSRSSVTSRIESGWFQVRIYANGFSDSYTGSSKSKKKSIDKISVNTTLTMNGSVENQKADNRTNSSFANASAPQKNHMIPSSAQYSKSSHAYHNKGANSIYHSTQAKRG